MTAMVHWRGSQIARRVRLAAAVVAIAVLLAGCAPAAEPKPTPTPRDPITLNIGALLPQTGSLAQYGPATTAAVNLAISDITEANAGITVTAQFADASDSTSETAVTSVTDLLGLGVTAIVGAISDGVSRKVIDQITSAGVVQISPGNTAPDFTSYADDGLYWRTAPSCELAASTLAQRIAQDGVGTLAVLDQPEDCPRLGQAVGESFEREGGVLDTTVTVDAAVALDAQVAELVASAPDAIAIASRAQAKAVIPLLLAAGYTGDQLYFVGLPPGDYSGDFAAGTLTGATAVQAGLDMARLKTFTTRLLAIDPTLTEFSYAAETYDAVMLLALAALTANSTDGAAIAAELQAVSGGSGDGKTESDFGSAATVILSGGSINYDGISGPITFDDNGDAAGAVIGVYIADETNTFVRED